MYWATRPLDFKILKYIQVNLLTLDDKLCILWNLFQFILLYYIFLFLLQLLFDSALSHKCCVTVFSCDQHDFYLNLIRHIYHYYIHGPRGNDKPVGRGTTASPFRNIDIQVS